MQPGRVLPGPKTSRESFAVYSRRSAKNAVCDALRIPRGTLTPRAFGRSGGDVLIEARNGHRKVIFHAQR
ncbi:MAG: hypothetical protein Q7R62_01665 [bacterium]|nr:hypothetical protein [bacterium]